jgi:hypothetical protein
LLMPLYGCPGIDLRSGSLRSAHDRCRSARMRCSGPTSRRGVPLARAATEAGVPLRAAQRWLARYRQGGSTGLACLIRHDAGRPSPGQPRRKAGGFPPMARLSYAPRVPRSRHAPIRLRFVPTKTDRDQSMIDRTLSLAISPPEAGGLAAVAPLADASG